MRQHAPDTQRKTLTDLGFTLDDARLRRAGLDYRDLAVVSRHPDLASCLRASGAGRVLAFSTRGHRLYSEASYRPDDLLLFGPETRGLPQAVLDAQPADQRLRLPMQPGSRSLNLSNAVAVVVFEAWRQLGFAGGR